MFVCKRFAVRISADSYQRGCLFGIHIVTQVGSHFPPPLLPCGGQKPREEVMQAVDRMEECPRR